MNPGFPRQCSRRCRRLGPALLAALFVVIPARTAVGAPDQDVPAAAPARDEIFYQIFLRSFCDSNGDRIGDLRGVRAHLDYLQGLGVTSILLTPIQPSPFYHNYFADSFEGVDPAYGTMRDFRALVEACHARGMKLYLDQEIQYVTQNHVWLKQSLGQPDSPYSRYVLYNGPANTRPEPLLPGVPALPSYDGRKIEVATVNLRDPAVRDYFQKLFVSWVDPHGDGSLRDGVDGFRIDHMMDDLDNKGRLTGLFADFWSPIFAAVREKEARTPAGKVQLTFIENHDVERFASVVGENPARERIGAAFDLLLRGTPLIYYGQELGMRGKQHRPWGSDANDIPVREAFRWTHDLEAPGSAIWYRGPHPWWTARFNRSDDGVSLEEENRDPHSLLAFYRRLLQIRAARTEIQTGRQVILDSAAAPVVCFLREQGAARTLVALNLAATPATVTFPPDEAAAAELSGAWVDLLHGKSPVRPGGLTLAPYEVLVAATP